jgi:predicted NUDIX family NTP pyrophosphohydrolase
MEKWIPVFRKGHAPLKKTLMPGGSRKRSAGILMYRRAGDGLEVLLVHPGGPFWAKKDLGAWSIPKGEYSEGEDPLDVAKRELVQPSRKVVTAFAIEGDFDPAALSSNTFELEWPPRSGRKATFPEVDRAQWFALAEAEQKILTGQREFIARLLQALAK